VIPSDFKTIFSLKTKREAKRFYKETPKTCFFKRSYINVLDNNKAFISNIYKDIIYLILFVNNISKLEIKTQRLIKS